MQAPGDTFMQHEDKKNPLHEFILIAEMSHLEFQSQMEAFSTTCCSFYVLCKMLFFLLGKSFLKLFATKLPLEMMHMTFILIKTLLFDL